MADVISVAVSVVLALVAAGLIAGRERMATDLEPGGPHVAGLFEDPDLAEAARAIELDHHRKVAALGDEYSSQLRALLGEQRRRRQHRRTDP